MRGAFLIWARRSLYVLHFTAVKKSLQRDTFALSETARLFVALEQRSAEMPLALSFIGGTQRHERRLAFTLSETIVMTRLASGPRQSVEALSFFA
jgi:hypothetical protein